MSLASPFPESLSDEPSSLEESMAQLAAAMDDVRSLEDTLTTVTSAALDLVPGSIAASITLRRGGARLESMGPTSEIASNADLLQYTLNEGPCLDAAREVPLIQSPDIRRDSRWPVWGPAAYESEGILSIVSVQLLSARGVHGALNIFSTEADAFDRDAVALAAVLAVHAGIAVRTTLLEEDLAAAVTSRRLIGQAQGLLMERFSLDEDASFALLRRLSQTSNVKVVEIARRVVDDRAKSVPTA